MQTIEGYTRQVQKYHKEVKEIYGKLEKEIKQINKQLENHVSDTDWKIDCIAKHFNIKIPPKPKKK